MYFDMISYNLAEGVTEEQLLKAAEEVRETWMKKQDGFISWTINKNKEGKDKAYVDIVEWRDIDAAKAAEISMNKDLPEDNAWYNCYDFASIETTNLRRLLKLQQ